MKMPGIALFSDSHHKANLVAPAIPVMEACARLVDMDVFTPARRHGPNAIVNIGYVGSLSAEMNVRLLHAVEAELDTEGLDVRFTLVGEGPERDWLRQHMLRAEFTGGLCGDALANAYAQMDIFAFPSATESVGNVVLEAMASGVPAVVMAHEGQRLLVDAGDTGILAQSPDAFVRGVRRLVKDRRCRERMGVAARARAVALVLKGPQLH